MHPAHFDHAALARDLLERHPILWEKIERACNLDSRAATDILADVLRFMNLVAFADRTLTPGKRIDDAWHEFILCTRTYMDFCQTHFRRMIHHYPGGTREENRQQFKNTLKLYNLYFGTPNADFWGASTLYAVEAKCGGCESGL